MSTLIEEIAAEHLRDNIPEFSVGDTVKVSVKVREGDRERIQVFEGIVIKRRGGYLMLNYFVFPGVSDTPAELDALSAWIAEDDVDMLQLRNLNIDPEVYLSAVEAAGGAGEPMGIVPWLTELRRRHPDLRFGYFNPPARLFTAPVDPIVAVAP